LSSFEKAPAGLHLKKCIFPGNSQGFRGGAALPQVPVHNPESPGPSTFPFLFFLTNFTNLMVDRAK
jgi:hypothetical protein